MVFKHDPGVLRDEFEQNGYVHLKDVLGDNFLAHLSAFYEQTQAEDYREQENWKIYGKKRQFLYNFASHEDAIEFRDGMAKLIGVDEDALTISERHLKVYDQDAEEWPAPHKDRAASAVSIGLPIHLPEGSSVCVFPELDFGANREERAVFLTEKDHPDLEQVYSKEQAVLLNESVGDVVVFLGSSIFHERVKAAGAAILYIKVNDDGRDPLGENIYGDASATDPA